MGVYRRSYRRGERLLTSRYWYCRDPLTGRERSLRVTDKAAAEILLGDLRRAAELRRAGVFVPVELRRQDPAEVVERYLAALEALGKARGYVRTIRSRLSWLAKQVRSLEELDGQRLVELLDLRAGEARLSPRTRNAYLTTVHGFFSWLARSGLWARGQNPAAAVERAQVSGNLVDRFALTIEQLTALVDGVPIWRAAAYVLAANTGLRRSELASIAEADVDLDAGTVRVRAASAKDRQDDVLPLNEWTVAVLRAYLAEVPPGRKVGRSHKARPRGAWLLPSVPQVETLRRDMRRLGIPCRTAAGERFDFHALRTTFITLLARADVPLALAQRLARHSDPRLTSVVYTRLTLHDGRAAVARLRPAGAGRSAGDTFHKSGDCVDGVDTREGRGTGSG